MQDKKFPTILLVESEICEISSWWVQFWCVYMF